MSAAACFGVTAMFGLVALGGYIALSDPRKSKSEQGGEETSGDDPNKSEPKGEHPFVSEQKGEHRAAVQTIAPIEPTSTQIKRVKFNSNVQVCPIPPRAGSSQLYKTKIPTWEEAEAALDIPPVWGEVNSPSGPNGESQPINIHKFEGLLAGGIYELAGRIEEVQALSRAEQSKLLVDLRTKISQGMGEILNTLDEELKEENLQSLTIEEARQYFASLFEKRVLHFFDLIVKTGYGIENYDDKNKLSAYDMLLIVALHGKDSLLTASKKLYEVGSGSCQQGRAIRMYEVARILP